MCDVAEPIIGVQRTFNKAELRGAESDKLLKSNAVLMVLVLVLGLILVIQLSYDSSHELTIQFKLLHHPSHIVRRRWRITGTTTTTSGWSNHPAKFNRG